MTQRNNKEARIGARLTAEARAEADAWIGKLRLSGDSELLELIFDAFNRNNDKEIFKFLDARDEETGSAYAIGFNHTGFKQEATRVLLLINQNNKIMSFAKEHNYVVWQLFGEMGITGDLENPTTLDQAIERLAQGPEKVLIVENYLRLHTSSEMSRSEFHKELPSILARVKAVGGSIRVCDWPTVEQVVAEELPLSLPRINEDWRRFELNKE